MRDRFASNNGCNPANPPDPAPGSGTHTTFVYSGCSAGHPTIWYAFDGGHTPVPTDRNGSQWLPAETWSFFTQFQTTPPTTTPPATTPPVTTSPPQAGACSATYRTVDSWPGGFQGGVTVRAGSSQINGWTVRWTLAGGQTITDLWSGAWSVSGTSVTVTNVSWNGSLDANAETTFGFLGSGSPSTPATPTCTSP
jgi:cellulase/cellobiase CelA1